ncbi:LANO_0D01266g1_1 [Lachancea nothofagi CBS 11611]|uniref:Dolichyl-diphosphooligosaccharide-protein glycosyltransferase subunit OST5 n=1 Tax=Lachancea nothofagi CBS 11611 TaxID=1266666 RepID=A0A1G4JDB0_9SACH|nr:LANO_0D01266g1_1 [Lachancea nothofagi CBS 11611]
MSYEEVYKLYHTSPEFQGFIALESQPVYATVTLFVALAFMLLALMSTSKVRGSALAVQFVSYTGLSFLGSIFFGLATVFLTNSFGVYA